MKNFNLSRECIGNITILSVIPANITLTNQGQSIPYEVDLVDNVLYKILSILWFQYKFKKKKTRRNSLETKRSPKNNCPIDYLSIPFDLWVISVICEWLSTIIVMATNFFSRNLEWLLANDMAQIDKVDIQCNDVMAFIFTLPTQQHSVIRGCEGSRLIDSCLINYWLV